MYCVVQLHVFFCMYKQLILCSKGYARRNSATTYIAIDLLGILLVLS